VGRCLSPVPWQAFILVQTPSNFAQSDQQRSEQKRLERDILWNKLRIQRMKVTSPLQAQVIWQANIKATKKTKQWLQRLYITLPGGEKLTSFCPPPLHPHLEQVLVVAVPPGPQPDVVPIKVARERADENRHQAVDAALFLDVLDHAESSIAE
jgi:hypothetical protein